MDKWYKQIYVVAMVIFVILAYLNFQIFNSNGSFRDYVSNDATESKFSDLGVRHVAYREF